MERRIMMMMVIMMIKVKSLGPCSEFVPGGPVSRKQEQAVSVFAGPLMGGDGDGDGDGSFFLPAFPSFLIFISSRFPHTHALVKSLFL